MQKSLFVRAAIIALLILLLLIPLGLIQGIVSQRQGLQRQVEHIIAESSAGSQRIAGPVLVVPYTEHETVVTTDDKGKKSTQVIDHARRMYFVPEKLVYDGAATVEPRYKGIYKALTYQTKGSIRAQFDVPAHLGFGSKVAITVGNAWLAMGLSDLRGLNGSPRIQWDDAALSAAAGARFEPLGDGIHAGVGVLDVQEKRQHESTIALDLAGSSVLSFAPVAKNTQVQLRATWPHPNFGGRFLPQSRQIDAAGFSARWEISHLANKNGALLAQGSERTVLEAFDVSFIEPVNIYLQAERAVKYGILFVALTFFAFFLFETLKNLRIHPLQYGLVGLALAVFFLLLVSLSEHLPFVYAYAAASSACVALVTYYLAHVLRGWWRGIAFGAKLAVLYGVLYGLLLSEDNALMLGSFLLFLVLAVVMVLTRRIDWYRLPESDADAQP